MHGPPTTPHYARPPRKRAATRIRMTATIMRLTRTSRAGWRARRAPRRGRGRRSPGSATALQRFSAALLRRFGAQFVCRRMTVLAQHGVDPVENNVVHLAFAHERDLPELSVSRLWH